jgi:glycolate oxidase FAD binding subunit
VVKNVTGYDLPKLLTGAFGTLGVITEVTLKVLPAAEMVRTLVLAGVAAADGVAALTAALGSPAEVSGAAWVPADLSFPHLPDRTPCALLRLEGPAVSVAARLAHLERLLDGRAAMAVLDGEESGDLWAALRDATPFAERPDLTIWKLSVPPAAGPAVLDRVKAEWPRAKAWADWGGGLIWLGLQGADAKGADAQGADARAAAVRGAIGPTGGHATLVRAPDSVRAAIPVFHPQPPALAALTARIRAQFDPAGILNPGRMTL